MIEQFFEKYGHFGNVDYIFEDFIKHVKQTIENLSIYKNDQIAVKKDNTNNMSKYILDKTSLNISFKDNNRTIFTLPLMHNGYFIINGIEKTVSIQELRTTLTYYNENTHSVTLTLPQSHNTIRIFKEDDEVFYMCTKNISSNINGIDKIAIIDVIQLFMKRLDKNILSMEVTAKTLFLRSRLNVSDEIKKKIKDQIFNTYIQDTSINDIQIAFTLRGMYLACLKGESSDNLVSSRLYRSAGFIFKKIFDAGIMKITKSSLTTKKDFENKLKKYIDTHVYKALKQSKLNIHGQVYEKTVMSVSRKSKLDVLSSIRRIIIPSDKNSSIMSIRHIKEDQKYFICPCETPEGKSVGLVKYLATTCVISRKVIKQNVLNYIYKHDDESFNKGVFIDDVYITLGYVNIVDLKKNVEYASVIEFENMYKITLTENRLMRLALLKEEDGTSSFPVLIDSSEQTNNSDLYADINAYFSLGFSASHIPFANHNQSARNVFSSGMIKQSIEVNYDYDITTHSERSVKFLEYGQKPVTQTDLGKNLGCINGLNLVVSILCFSGYNQEDAIILNKASVERGIFRTTTKSLVSYEINSDYIKIDEDLYMSKEPSVNVVKLNNLDDIKRIIRKDELLYTEESRTKNIQVGDKLASRHSQKGVISLILSPENLPFTKEGIIPDMIINPHCIPSRMTMGQLLESILSTESLLSGNGIVDGTPFSFRDKIDDISSKGNSIMFNPYTGEEFENKIFTGVVYYMAMKHQVDDKIYIRNDGNYSPYSFQPVGGRSKGGGLRFGEMELDCLIAHGTSHCIKNISESSDTVSVNMCKSCRYFPVRLNRCELCHNNDNDNITEIKIPYSLLMIKNHLSSTNIVVRKKVTL